MNQNLDLASRIASFDRILKVFKLTKAEKQDYRESVRRRLLGCTQEGPKTISDPSNRI